MNPRDPRARRSGGPFAQPVDAAAAAVRLEVAAEAMRHGLLSAGPADVAAPVQLPTYEPPFTLQAFAAGLGDDPGDYFGAEGDNGSAEQASSPEPAPVPAVDPPTPAPVPEPVPPVFGNEHRPVSWRSRHDARSLSYGVRPTLRGSVALQDVMLPIGPVLDQGSEGACFGFAAAAALNAMHLAGLLDNAASWPLDAAAALELYRLAQRRDERPGEDYDGTSVTGGMRAVVEEHLAGGYLWSFGTRDIAQTLLHRRGAVIVGVPWLSGMYDTGPGGLVALAGDDQGLGHCLAIVGLKLKGPQGQPGPFFVWQNSWGTGYGDGGLGYVHHRDLAALLHGAGEAAIPTRDAQAPADV
jgi:hypothetical protein